MRCLRYIRKMNGFLIFLLAAAMLATLGALGIGLFSMVKGGEFNKKHGNKMMQWRVILQGAAVVLIAILFYASQK